jgi:COP9 signalosome complex subunit 5
MMTHCQSGVDKGRSSRSTRSGATTTLAGISSNATTGSGNPIEVMGLLLGRPDPTATTTLVVTDAFPLPIEGFETRVVADDESVVNHMIALGEVLEQSRKERFMGWYHSHPFDLKEDGSSHCFLSQTDLTTQLQWQRAEDGHGNPFCAIVVDPLLSLHVGTPQLKAFRAYPPEYASPTRNECPDGSIQPNEQVRLELWGSCWNRYYELPMEYFMSSSARYVLEQLTKEYLWMRTLTTSPHATNAQQGGSGNSGGGGGGSHAHASAGGAASRTSELITIANTMDRVSTEANLMRQVRSDVSGGASLSSSTGAMSTSRASSSSGGAGSFGWNVASATATSTTASGDSSSNSTTNNKNPVEDLHQATRQLANIASDQLQDLTLQWTKQQVFGGAAN